MIPEPSIVQKGMDNLMKGRTVFVMIAHRLSTIRNSDAIIVLDHGRIIERGDHEDLIRLKGTYYQLYTGKLESVIKQLKGSFGAEQHKKASFHMDSGITVHRKDN